MVQEIKKKLDINSKNYLQVLEIIKAKGNKARLIGGAVRDAMLGVPAYDVDIATDMLPDNVTETFSSLGYKVIPTGIKFGTVSLLYQDEIFEITTLRKDLSCDGRRARVEYTNDFYLDALRRDFTINALSYDPFEELIYDYFSGLKDLRDGIVKFIGDPELRIKEDHLRILRFFRFFGRFGKELDENTLNACIYHKKLLKILSRERIKSEFDLILKLPNYLSVLDLMNKSDILREILPLNDNSFVEANFIAAEKLATKFGVSLVKETKYALLFASSCPSFNDLVVLKFSRLEAKRICFLLVLLEQKSIDEHFLKKLWFENSDFTQAFIFIAVMFQEEKCSAIIPRACSGIHTLQVAEEMDTVVKPRYDKQGGFYKNYLLRDDIEAIFFKLQNVKKQIFPLNGNDMNMLGFSGSQVGSNLTALKELWIASNFELNKYDLIKMISKKYEK